jgi:peptidase C39-like protein
MAIRSWVALGAVLAGVGAVHAAPVPYQAAVTRWRGSDGGFSAWGLTGVVLGADGALRLDPATAASGTDPYPPGGYNGRNFYNGGAFIVGEATSPVTAATFAFREAIGSWNAATPAGTWVETLVRARFGARWTKWYNLGIWAEDDGAVQRHSVNLQGDADGTVSVDTLKLTYKKKDPPNAYQLKVRLFRAPGGGIPSLGHAAVAVSTTPDKPRSLVAGNPAYWSHELAVPECSQMVYPDGGTVWCSPTSVSMVLAYWQQETGPCEPRVRTAVAGVYDWLYDGHGNWPFNTAYASARAFESWVGRFTTMAEAERWLDAGVPLVISYAWGNGDLTGAPIPTSNGHLAVLVGFDADGNPVINDPAAASDADVRRTYPRAELETLWLQHSGGTVYAIYPAGWPIPD